MPAKQYGLHQYYYDAANGEILWSSANSIADLAHGDAGDMDAVIHKYAEFAQVHVLIRVGANPCCDHVFFKVFILNGP